MLLFVLLRDRNILFMMRRLKVREEKRKTYVNMIRDTTKSEKNFAFAHGVTETLPTGERTKSKSPNQQTNLNTQKHRKKNFTRTRTILQISHLSPHCYPLCKIPTCRDGNLLLELVMCVWFQQSHIACFASSSALEGVWSRELRGENQEPFRTKFDCKAVRKLYRTQIRNFTSTDSLGKEETNFAGGEKVESHWGRNSWLFKVRDLPNKCFYFLHCARLP